MYKHFSQTHLIDIQLEKTVHQLLCDRTKQCPVQIPMISFCVISYFQVPSWKQMLDSMSLLFFFTYIVSFMYSHVNNNVNKKNPNKFRYEMSQ